MSRDLHTEICSEEEINTEKSTVRKGIVYPELLCRFINSSFHEKGDIKGDREYERITAFSFRTVKLSEYFFGMQHVIKDSPLPSI